MREQYCVNAVLVAMACLNSACASGVGRPTCRQHAGWWNRREGHINTTNMAKIIEMAQVYHREENAYGMHATVQLEPEQHPAGLSCRS